MITAVPEDLATTNGAIEEDKSLAAEAHPFERRTSQVYHEHGEEIECLQAEKPF